MAATGSPLRSAWLKRAVWRTLSAMRCAARSASLLMLLASVALGGCDRDAPSADSNGNASDAFRVRPTYRFAAGIREEHPEIALFMQSFLETCLTEDYEGYRRFVSRRRLPESKERFDRIYQAIETLRVESVDEVAISELPAPVFRVISSVTFKEVNRPIFRRERNQIAILVFEEEGEYRMLPAPEALQPEPTASVDAAPEDPAVESEPQQPHYPWDEEPD